MFDPNKIVRGMDFGSPDGDEGCMMVDYPFPSLPDKNSTLSNFPVKTLSVDELENGIKSLTKKPMPKSIIKHIFQSQEKKAFNFFGLLTDGELNEHGLLEFLRYIYETNEEMRKGFTDKIKEAYEQERK